MINRRQLLKTTAAAGAAAAFGGLARPAIAQGAAIKLGYVSPQTGPLAAFAEADKFIIDGFLAATKATGANFEVIVKDSQSNPNRAAEVAKELIVNDEVNLMLVASTPETTNPVATTCEAEGLPCISTVAPWQPWFIGQQGNPGDPASWQPFESVFHFFWGLEDVIAVFTNMWAQLETNKSVGGLFPNDGDRSHYEYFRPFHQAIYRHVEPTSVTPFSIRVRERALHAIATALVRFWDERCRYSPDPAPSSATRHRVIDSIMDRVRNVDPGEISLTGQALDEFFDLWEQHPPALYGTFGNRPEETPLMYPAGSMPSEDWSPVAHETPSSMRNVDVECQAQPLWQHSDHVDARGTT